MSLGDSNTSASPAALANVQKYGGKIGKHGERDYTEEKMFKIGFLGTCLNVMMFALDQVGGGVLGGDWTTASNVCFPVHHHHRGPTNHYRIRLDFQARIPQLCIIYPLRGFYMFV